MVSNCIKNSSTDKPFKSFKARTLDVEDFKKIFNERLEKAERRFTEEDAKQKRKRKRSALPVQKAKTLLEEKDLPAPVKMSPEILAYLRSQLNDVREDERRKWAKYGGIGLVDPAPLMGEILWDLVALCALHYKTTKVLDILNLCTHTLAAYDEIRGHSIGNTDNVGKSLSHFLKCISESEVFKGKLMVYAEKTESLFIKTAGEAKFSSLGEASKKLESFLCGDDICRRRLIGEQANVVLLHVEELLGILEESRNQWEGQAANRKHEKGLNAAISAIYLIASYTRDIVYLMSLSAHPEGENELQRTSRLEKIAKRFRHTAAMLEYIQSFAFPDWFRPYDLTVTCCGPDIMDSLVAEGFLMGEVGLLEVFEAYHQYMKGLPVMQFYCKTGIQESACMSKLIKTLLIHIHGENIDPLNCEKEYRTPYIHHKSKKLTKTSKHSYVKVIHDYDGIGCACGRNVDGESCEHCRYGVCHELHELAQECANILLSGNFTDADVERIHETRKKLTKFIFVKGLFVSKK